MPDTGTASGGGAATGVSAVIKMFVEACELFGQALERTDNLLDATDFTGVLHMLALTAGRVRALGEALTVLTGDSAWIQQADAVLAEYMQATPASEVEGPEH